MNCSKCGSVINENEKFCPSCGEQVIKEAESNSVTCSHCFNVMPAGTRFCSKCGAPIQSAGENYKKQSKMLYLVIGILIVVIVGLTGGITYTVVNRNSKIAATSQTAAPFTQAPQETAAALQNTAQPAVVTAVPAAAPPAAAPAAPPASNTRAVNNYYIYNSDTSYITESYLNMCSRDEVRLILNEIYARHGYIFSTEQYSSYFASQRWYTPIYSSTNDVEKYFNSIERANKETIVNYEKARGWR